MVRWNDAHERTGDGKGGEAVAETQSTKISWAGRLDGQNPEGVACLLRAEYPHVFTVIRIYAFGTLLDLTRRLPTFSRRL